VHLYSQKKFQLSSSRKIILIKNVFMPTMQLVEKYFVTLLWQIYFINKKVAQCLLLYTQKNYSPKIENLLRLYNAMQCSTPNLIVAISMAIAKKLMIIVLCICQQTCLLDVSLMGL
jgi:hypothetical protein